MQQSNPYLEQIQREGLLPVTVGTGEFKERVWIFARPQRKAAIDNSSPTQ